MLVKKKSSAVKQSSSAVSQSTQVYDSKRFNIISIPCGDKKQHSSRFRLAIMINNKPINQQRFSSNSSYDYNVETETCAVIQHIQDFKLNDTIGINLFDIGSLDCAMSFTFCIESIK